MQALTKDIFIGDVLIRVYSLRFLAAKLHRMPNALKAWEHRKILPKPIFQTKEQRRWYTAEEVELYTRLADEEQLTNGQAAGFKRFAGRAFGERKILEQKLLADLREAMK